MNTTQTKHTALPWRIASSTEIWAYDQPILTIAHEENSNLPADVANANQAFIVRACNSHYELLNACKVAVAYLRCAGMMPTDHKASAVSRDDAESMYAAIALAERGQRVKYFITLGNIMLKEAGEAACQSGYGTVDPEWVGRYALAYGDINRDGTLN